MKRLISGSGGGGGGGTPGGSDTQVQFNNASAFGGISTFTFSSSILTTSGRFINSYNAAGIPSAPAKAFTGTWFTGGSATTTKPQVVIEPTGTTSTGWSTNGTGLGVNAASGFAGNLLDLQVNGTATVTATGVGGISAPRSALDGGTLAGYFFRSGTDVLGFRCDTSNNIGVFTRGSQTFSSYMFGSVARPIFKLGSAFSIAWGSNDVAVQVNEDIGLARSAAGVVKVTNGSTGDGTISGQHRLVGTAPASATATGTAGDIRFDADFIYICTATNTWKRTAITTWV